MKSIIKENTVKTRRPHDDPFKREAVQNWLNRDESVGLVAYELDVREFGFVVRD